MLGIAVELVFTGAPGGALFFALATIGLPSLVESPPKGESANSLAQFGTGPPCIRFNLHLVNHTHDR